MVAFNMPVLNRKVTTDVIQLFAVLTVVTSMSIYVWPCMQSGQPVLYPLVVRAYSCTGVYSGLGDSDTI